MGQVLTQKEVDVLISVMKAYGDENYNSLSEEALDKIIQDSEAEISEYDIIIDDFENMRDCQRKIAELVKKIGPRYHEHLSGEESLKILFIEFEYALNNKPSLENGPGLNKAGKIDFLRSLHEKIFELRMFSDNLADFSALQTILKKLESV